MTLQRPLRALAYAHAATRTAIGLGFLLAPDRTARPWLGKGIERGGGQVALRAFAVRDVILGVGQLHALRTGAPVRRWFQLGILAEVVDGGSAMLAGDELCADAPELMNAMSVLGAVGGVVLGVGLRDPR